jgi:hypothetical protein
MFQAQQRLVNFCYQLREIEELACEAKQRKRVYNVF